MGFWKEVKKEWTWNSSIRNWPDMAAAFVAGFVASEYKPLWKFFLVWLFVFFISKFVILCIAKLIKKN